MTGLLLAGIGHVDPQQKKNFLIVDSSKCSILLLTLAVVSASERFGMRFSGSEDIEYPWVGWLILVGTRNANKHDRVCVSRVHREEGYRDFAHQPTCK